jgi:hypothetical protein
MADEALALARAGGDKREEANALFTLGLMAGLVGGAGSGCVFESQTNIAEPTVRNR